MSNNARRAKKENLNDVVPSQAPQNPQVPIEARSMSNMEIGETIHRLTQVLNTQVTSDATV